MSNQSRSGTIARLIGAVSSTLFLCCGPSLARSAAAQITSDRLQNIQKAKAELKKRIAADWLAVIAADKAEVASLNAATAAAMKANNPNAVVSAQGLLKTVQARLVSEKAEPPFPPYFQAAANTVGLSDPALKIEAARNAAVAAAVAQTHLAQAAFHDAVVAADQNAIAQWKKRVSADMKADKPQAVVTDMSSMKQSQQQLQQDSMAAPAMLLNRGMANQFQPVYTPPAMLPGAGMLNPTVPAYRPPGFFPGAGQPMQGNAASGQSTSIGNGISSDQWPKLVQHAMKPVGWNSVPSLAAELSRYQTSPSKLIGKRVVAYVVVNKQNQLVIKGSRGPRLILPQTDASQLYTLRRQLVEQFDALYKWAADREKSEYQNALVRNERPGLMAQVPPTEVRAEQIECAKVVVPARQAEVGEQSAIGKALRSPHNTMQLVGLPGTAVPKIGPVYGVVTGIASVKTPVTIPKYRYAPNYTQPSVATDSLVMSKPHVHYRVTLLFCARAPHYFSPAKKRATGPIRSYVFKMKSGTKMDATTYTTGDFYYHLKWNGIDLPVAKDLVVKIIPVR